MEQQVNPILELQNPFVEYQKNIESLGKNDSQMMRDEQLCYEIFHMTDTGKELMSRWEKNILMIAKVNPSRPEAMQLSLYHTAVRDFIIGIKMQADNHLMRITAANKDTGNAKSI